MLLNGVTAWETMTGIWQMLRIIAKYLKAKCILHIICAHLGKKVEVERAKTKAEKICVNVNGMKGLILTLWSKSKGPTELR